MKKRNYLSAAIAFTLCLFTFGACSGQNVYSGGYLSTEDAGLTAGEDYTEIVENAFIKTAEQSSSYFSIDANTASYPNLRNLIENGLTIPKDAVRVEEMLNYFSYDYETPENDDILALTSSVFDTPYNSETKLMTIGLAAKEVELSSQSNNLVFLIDVSGSMNSPEKLPLVQESFKLLTESLGESDRVSVVTYASGDAVALDGAYGYEKSKILSTIEDLSAGGTTAGSRGIERAYQLAEEHFIEGGNNRVILATDGDFNVGVTSNAALEELIAEKRETGVYFSVFGFGRGNIQSSKMETLALAGNGAYSYIDSKTEAKRALVEEINGTLLTVAKDVKAGVTFNAEYVDSYRLIGYENKLLTQEEFEDDATDAGELGSGHKVTVVYELKLTQKALADGGNFAQVSVKYKPTENSGGLEEESSELKLDIATSAYRTQKTTQDSFIAAVIEFALLLRDSAYKGDATLDGLLGRLNALDLESDEFKKEFRALVVKYQENI